MFCSSNAFSTHSVHTRRTSLNKRKRDKKMQCRW
jgi:hypothetical protein